MKRRELWAVGVVLASGLACGSPGRAKDFSGTFVFTNVTVDEIWVDRVEGFDFEPPCGRMVPGGEKTIANPPMPFPHEIRLRWYPVGHPEQMRLTSLTLSGLHPGPKQELELVFNDDGWQAQLGN